MKNSPGILFLIILSSCGDRSNLTYSERTRDNLPIEEIVSFDRLKVDILSTRCVSCHRNASTEDGLKQWLTPGKPDSSPLFLRTEDGSMPKNAAPLSTGELEEIRNYIVNLSPPAPTPGPDPTPTPAVVAFSEIKTQILTPYRCTSCHRMSTEAAVARYINSSSPDQSPLYGSVKNGSMPQGGPTVSAEKKILLLKYVRDYVRTH